MEPNQVNSQVGLMLDTVRKAVPAPALYEALAEEATEVAQAALKMARIQRQENPTPVDLVDATKSLNEELTDLLLCMDVVNMHADQNLAMAKLNRWISRLAQAGKVQPQVTEMQATETEVIEDEPQPE